jgi:4'-phosphopantetheinyl transferase
LTAPVVVDVWIAHPPRLVAPDLVDRYEALLAPDEAARRRAYVREVNRQEFLVTRALVRTTLSRYRPTEPAAWRFGKNAYGRPHVEPPCGLSFNLSNSIDLVACAVVEGRELGVDVEPIARADDVLEVAETVFSPRELRELRALPDLDRRRARGLDLWTLKESYIKARGMGLSLPLDRFSFAFDDPAEVRIRIEPDLGDRDDRWRFRQLDVAGHRLSLAVEAGPDASVEVRVHDVTP